MVLHVPQHTQGDHQPQWILRQPGPTCSGVSKAKSLVHHRRRCSHDAWTRLDIWGIMGPSEQLLLARDILSFHLLLSTLFPALALAWGQSPWPTATHQGTKLLQAETSPAVCGQPGSGGLLGQESSLRTPWNFFESLYASRFSICCFVFNVKEECQNMFFSTKACLCLFSQLA